MKPPTSRAAQDLLAFYVESGVDAALDETPVDHFADRGSEAFVAADPSNDLRALDRTE